MIRTLRTILIVAVLSAAGLTMMPREVIAQPQHAAEKYGFGFVNFGTPILTWDVFRRSFFGIPRDTLDLRTTVTSPFDVVFYDLVFKTALAAPGNCFGISLLSLMMNHYGGYLGFCCPPAFYRGDVVGGGGPTDAELRRTINIMHGRQVSAAAIRSYLEQFRDGHSQNASYAVELARRAIAQEGACLVSITQKMNPQDGGHTMIAYNVTEEPPASGNFKIWVVDPNRLWVDTSMRGRGWYTGRGGTPPKNYIDCRRSGGSTTWQFRMAGGSSDWPTERDDTVGQPLGRGNLTILPRSLVGPTGRSPSSLGIAVLELAGIILISGNGEQARITQVHDAAGKRLFGPGGDIDWDPATGMRTMIPWYPSASAEGGGFPFQAWFNDGQIGDASIDFEGGPRGMTLAVGNNGGYIRVGTAEPGMRARLRIAGNGTAQPRVTIENASADARFDIEIVVASEGGRTVERYFLDGATVPAKAGGAVELTVNPFSGVSVGGVSDRPARLRYVRESLIDDRAFASAPVGVVPAAGATVEPAGWPQPDGKPGN